jgi:hypothetical protein
MKLYASQFNVIARDIVRTLQKSELIDIEKDLMDEAELDIVGVLKEYNRMDRQLTNAARDAAGSDGRAAEGREKARMAREKNFRTGEEAMEYIVAQIMETFMQSDNISEIFGTDAELRRSLTLVLRRYTQDKTEELDVEVRSKLKNIQEGTSAWDIEYARMMEKVKQRKGLAD